MRFETAIWPFRSATRCFYWASKLLSGTFSAPLKSLKTLETLAAAFDGLSLLCHGTSRGPTSCFCWASKLLSGTSEAPQAVSIGLRNCYLARFQRPLKASKPSQQLSTAFRCFAMGPPEAPRAVSVGLRNCYLALPRRDKLFLLGFETAIWHVAAFDGLSLLCHGSSRGPTSCFCWASKLLSGTSEAPQAVSILGFETAIWHLFSTLKSLKTLKTLPAAFDGLSLLCHGSSRGPTSCFCWASKLLSDTSEAPQAVSIGLRNCYLARFQHPLKASKPSKPSQQLSTAFRCFAMGPPRRHKLFLLGVENAIWHVAAFDGHSLLCHGSSRGPHKLLAVSIGLRNCYLARFQHPLKASKPSKPSQQLSTALPWVLPRPHKLFLLGFETAIWHFRSATRCFYLASQLLSGTLQLSTAFRCFAMGPTEAPQAVSVGLRNCYLALPRRDKLFLLGFETAIWHVAAFDGLSLLCHGSSRGPTSCFCWASKLLSGTSEAPQAVSILGFETAIWHLFSTLKSLKTLKTLPAAFDGLSLLCHGSSRGPTSCFCWASKLLSDTSEAPQAVSIGLRNCYLARFQHPLKASKPSKPSQQLSTAFRCFAMGPPRRHKLFLLGVENAIWHVAAFDGHSLLCHGSSRGPTGCWLFLLGFETAIWQFRSAPSCFYWASKLLSGTFSAPLKSFKTLKTLPAAFDGLSLLCHGTSEAPQAVSVGLRNCYLTLPKRPKLFLLGFETAIWHVFSTP